VAVLTLPPALGYDLYRVCDVLWAESTGTKAETLVCFRCFKCHEYCEGPCKLLRSGSASSCRWTGRVDSRAESQRCSRLIRCHECGNVFENTGGARHVELLPALLRRLTCFPACLTCLSRLRKVRVGADALGSEDMSEHWDHADSELIFWISLHNVGLCLSVLLKGCQVADDGCTARYECCEGVRCIPGRSIDDVASQ